MRAVFHRVEPVAALTIWFALKSAWASQTSEEGPRKAAKAGSREVVP